MLTIAGVAVLQLALASLHIHGWSCPFWDALGIPCPGCGLTRATLLLLRGEWRSAVHVHAFAPILVLTLGVAIWSAVLPEVHRIVFLKAIAAIERKSRISLITLTGLILYWLARLLLMRGAFVQLLQH